MPPRTGPSTGAAPLPFSFGPKSDSPIEVGLSNAPVSLRYDGRVAVVTGAGNGLGRAYALTLGSRGAKVVVNDLGGGVKGEAAEAAAARPADKVVAEIKALGGEAVPNYDSVENGESIIKTAIDTWGKIDILVNNAGILRDTSLRRMTPQDWDMVYNVHMKGTYGCTRAAWNEMEKAKYGRIVNVSSAAGIYGNFGQTNYSAMKLAIAGFTLALAREGAANNIRANVMAPIAGTRMTATVMKQEQMDALSPDFVAPVVGYLCHESVESSGGIFEVGAGWIAKLRWQRSEGVLLDITQGKFTVEDVAKNYGKISDFETRPTYPRSVDDSFRSALPNMKKLAASKKSKL